MNKHSLSRIATAVSSFGVAALASIFLATPAQATVAPEPDARGGSTATSTVTSPAPSGADWRQIGLGAAGGIVLAGAGAVALGGSRRQPHGARTA